MIDAAMFSEHKEFSKIIQFESLKNRKISLSWKITSKFSNFSFD